MDGAVDISPGGFRIDYIRPGMGDGQSIVATPVTGSLGVPGVIGLVGRRDSAVESRVLDQNFHDVTIVDMGDLPESNVSMPEMTDLMHKWPPAVINHMMWWQRKLEEMCRATKIKFRQSHPSPCTFCGTLIRCDMYRHVARCHLELAQLWRCPVSWCTYGRARIRMDHIR